MEDQGRKQRGMEIAAMYKIHKKKGSWSVPSMSGNGYYMVDMESQKCSCLDYETRECKCKHIFAVEFVIKRKQNADGSTTVTQSLTVKRKTYPQNWTAYNAAQTREKEMVSKLLRGLCDGIIQPVQKMGRPRLPLADVVFSATMKVYGTLSGRRTTCDLRDCETKGFVSSAPHYNTVFKYLEDQKLTPILKTLITESALPLKDIEEDFAIDSSGFSTCTYTRWFDEKYGKHANQHDWVKLHVTTGTKTNIVTAAEVTEASVHDNTQFKPLINATAENFDMREVSADKAYLSKENLALVVGHGAVPYIPFKSNTTGEGPKLWKKMYHLYQFKRDQFLDHYHKRSNVESTVWMIKSKFGKEIRSKLPVSQENELLLKVLCHNLSVVTTSIFEFGIEPEFWSEKEAA